MEERLSKDQEMQRVSRSRQRLHIDSINPSR